MGCSLFSYSGRAKGPSQLELCACPIAKKTNWEIRDITFRNFAKSWKFLHKMVHNSYLTADAALHFALNYQNSHSKAKIMGALPNYPRKFHFYNPSVLYSKLQDVTLPDCFLVCFQCKYVYKAIIKPIKALNNNDNNDNAQMKPN